MILRLEIIYGEQMPSEFDAKERVSFTQGFLTALHRHHIYCSSFGFMSEGNVEFYELEIDGRRKKEALSRIQKILIRYKVEPISNIIELEPIEIKIPRIRRKGGRPTTQGVVPPDYLTNNAIIARREDPAVLLFDGRWCGHGMEKYAIFSVLDKEEHVFRFKLSQDHDNSINPPQIIAISRLKNPIVVYDARKHPANIYADEHTKNIKTRMKRYFCCPGCSSKWFHLAVGFEYPDDSDFKNDVSWFALATKCNNCEWSGIIYQDETA